MASYHVKVSYKVELGRGQTPESMADGLDGIVTSLNKVATPDSGITAPEVGLSTEHGPLRLTIEMTVNTDRTPYKTARRIADNVTRGFGAARPAYAGFSIKSR